MAFCQGLTGQGMDKPAIKAWCKKDSRLDLQDFMRLDTLKICHKKKNKF